MSQESQESNPEKKGCPTCGGAFAPNGIECPADGTRLLTQAEFAIARLSSGTHQEILSLVGSQIAGHYEITEFLGEGGMSLVYKAKQLPLERMVAIKILKKHALSDELKIKRFFQEARTVSTLAHPNIISLLDFGVSETAVPYMVMDFLEGKTLSSAIANKEKFDLIRFIHVFSQVCDALYHAHNKGVLHRDLKPGNIMLVDEQGDVDFVKILDFGIAKLLPWADSNMQHLTHTGEVFGSPLYMSPEQCLGHELDLRSDIYSLGCVMYEVLTGEPPFVGGNILETMQRQAHEMPRPLTQANPQANIPPAINAIVLKCLSKDKLARQQTMENLRLELVSCQSKRAAAAAAVNQALTRAAPVKQPSRLAQVLALIVALALPGFVYWRLWQVAAPGMSADLNWDNFSRAGQSAFDGQNYTAAEKNFQAAVAQASVFGKMDKRLIKSMKSLRDVYRAEGKFKKSSALESQIARIKQERLLNEFGVTAAKLNSLIDSTLKAVPQPIEKGKTNDYEEIADTLSSLANVCAQESNFVKAERLYKAALQLDEHIFGEDSWPVALKLNDLAFYYIKQDEVEKAEPLLKRAMPILQRSLGSNTIHPAASTGATWLSQYTQLLRDMQRQEQAAQIELKWHDQHESMAPPP